MSRPAHPCREQALVDLANGDEITVVAERYRAPLATVRRWAGVPGRKQGRPVGSGDRTPRALHQDGRTALIHELLLSGLSQAEAAEVAGVTRQAAHVAAKSLPPGPMGDPAPPPRLPATLPAQDPDPAPPAARAPARPPRRRAG